MALPKPPKPPVPGQKAKPTRLQSRPPAKHPWDPGYKASKKVVREAKKVFDAVNPFD